jgi:hypothetical protein
MVDQKPLLAKFEALLSATISPNVMQTDSVIVLIKVRSGDCSHFIDHSLTLSANA